MMFSGVSAALRPLPRCSEQNWFQSEWTTLTSITALDVCAIPYRDIGSPPQLWLCHVSILRYTVLFTFDWPSLWQTHRHTKVYKLQRVIHIYSQHLKYLLSCKPQPPAQSTTMHFIAYLSVLSLGLLSVSAAATPTINARQEDPVDMFDGLQSAIAPIMSAMGQY